jgi:hypothetical protein
LLKAERKKAFGREKIEGRGCVVAFLTIDSFRPYFGGDIFFMGRFPDPQMDELLGATDHQLKAQR